MPVPPKQVQPCGRLRAVETLRGGDHLGGHAEQDHVVDDAVWPGSMRAEVTNASPVSFGSSRKQR